MAYYKSILATATGEEVIHIARVHWITYLPGIVWLIIPPVGLVLLLVAAINNATTEMIITNQRIVYKRGLIRRFCVDLARQRVETITLQQSIPGRILDYGHIVIHGIGIGQVEFKNVAKPIEFRRFVTS